MKKEERKLQDDWNETRVCINTLGNIHVQRMCIAPVTYPIKKYTTTTIIIITMIIIIVTIIIILVVYLLGEPLQIFDYYIYMYIQYKPTLLSLNK